MIRSFGSRGTEDVFNGRPTKHARAAMPKQLERRALLKLEQIDYAAHLHDLRVTPGKRLEALRGKRAGQHSIRINDQYRICFVWTDSEPEAVEIVDYH